MITIYTLSNCDSCRKATKWLRAYHIAFEEKPIRETPPSPGELRTMLALQDGGLRRLFNTAGQEFRAAGLKDKLPAMRVDEAIALLSANGSLVKRPFLIGPGIGLVGFDEAAWLKALT